MKLQPPLDDVKDNMIQNLRIYISVTFQGLILIQSLHIVDLSLVSELFQTTYRLSWWLDVSLVLCQ